MGLPCFRGGLIKHRLEFSLIFEKRRGGIAV
jgi:hypothetical protein